MTVVGAVRPVNLRFRYTVEINRFTSFAFNKVGALSMESATVDYYEGGAVIPIKLPGRVTVADIEMSRGAGLDHEMYDWALEVVDVVRDGGLVQNQFKRDLDVVQRDRDGSEVYRWNVYGAWPKKFVAGEWDSTSDEAVIQNMTLCVDAFKLVR